MIVAIGMPTWLNFMRQHVVLVAAIVVHLISIGGLVYANQAPESTSSSISLPAESDFPVPTVSGIPTEVSIPSLNIRLTIEPGRYDKTSDSWTLSGYNAHFATATRPANNGGGNTFIYGHNNRHVFGPIKSIAPGAEAKITTDVGNTFYYSLESTKTVEPTDVSLFTYTGAPILTIQTCTGLWHEQRQLYTFKLQRYEESQRSVAIRTEAERKQLLQTVAAVASPTFRLPSEATTDAPPVRATLPAAQDQPASSPQKFTLSSLVNMEKPLFAQLR